ncbi:Ig-like domain-containing protein [uncultured Gulosibacter sp.]|uniref:Ig-like domain-containing protein n=1 Tax=uncultured Gulosibacter sp. TaxID=1339167 RepID=UPI00288A6C16|nr:Ig-like domain-containing protein [uncultured Gulosibacter sp.]
MVAALTIGGFAFAHPGIPEARVDLNEGGVWVTNGESGLVGHLNYPARTMESWMQLESSAFDITQSERDVLLVDQTSNSVAAIDIANTVMGTANTPEFEFRTAQGANESVLLNVETGQLWAAPVAELGSTQLTSQTALPATSADGVVAGGVDGTLYAASAQDQTIVRIAREGIGYVVETETVEALTPGHDIQLTVVGDKPVVFDTTAGTVILPSGRTVELPSAQVEVQLPGPESDEVVAADATTLYRINLNNGDTTSMAPSQQQAGTAARPAVVGDCAYGAWSGSGNFLRWCDDETRTKNQRVETLTTAEQPEFRVNRNVIVLNDIGKGSVWLPDDNMVLIDNWDEIENELNQREEQEDSPQLNDEVAEPDRKAENKPPVAQDDEFGVRPGSSTQLPVLMNDSDPDGDLLTASVTEQPASLRVQQSRGGAALQVSVPADASGVHTFTYQAADGRGGTAAAKVKLTVRPFNENDAPEQRRVPNVVVAAGATVDYNVTPDWVDPDGDMFYLEAVKAPDELQVQFREDGTLSITELSGQPGTREVTVVMSDGKATREGRVNVEVRPAQNAPPIAHGDFVVVREHATTTVAPLDNDVDPNGDRLSLVSISAAPPGTSVQPSLENGTFDFSASAKGSYYLSYVVTDGPSSSTGVIRIDVVAADTDAPPVAQDDLALLPAGGSTLVAPLNNDFDPGGGVLVVQSVSVPDGSPVVVSLVDHHLLRVKSSATLTGPVSVKYTISNGQDTATAEVHVVPTSDRDISVPPEPENDRLRVRVGDVGAVDVLSNDRSVNGLRLRVDPELVHEIPKTVGHAFVTGSEVRFHAGTQTGSYRVTYNAVDEVGNFASASVLIEVVGDDEAANSAPQPSDLTAWSVAGRTTRIPVPLTGIDPDGDSVSLVGVQQVPSMGTATLGAGWFNYTPNEGAAGTDSFTYIVEDRFGKQATARVRVGVAPPATVNQPPVAVEDSVRVRPSRSISVDVLANDSDPDGDPIAILPDQVDVVGVDPEKVTASERLIRVETPAEQTTITVGYRVTDGRGGESYARLSVHVTPDAPLRAPEPGDDIVTQKEVDAAERGVVRVSVLDNDIDPDGDRDALELFTTADDVEVDGRRLLIPVSEQRRLVVYGVRDADGLEGFAVVTVPGTKVERPRINEALVPMTMRAGETIEIDLKRVVTVRPGREASITDPASVQAGRGLTVADVAAGANKLQVTAAADFSGNSVVSFEVADGNLDSDRGTRTATLSVPIVVTAEKNAPPEIRPSPISVAAAEGPTVANICQMVTDPDGTPSADLDYRLGTFPNTLRVGLDGCNMSVELIEPQPVGPLGAIEIKVDDGHGAVSGSIPVSAISSNRPLIQVSDVVINTGQPGKTETIDLDRYLINPFPDKPITVIGSPTITRGQGTVDVQGTTMSVTPSQDMLGTFTIQYVVGDATGDPARQVTGVVRVVVRDKPEPPKNISAEVVGPGSVLVKFTAGDNNGAPITEFRVTTRTGETTTCNTSECLVTDLQNGSTHEFSVTAVNEVGESEPSGWSAPVLVDVQPGRPAPPQLRPRDGAIDVRVLPTESLGSPVKEYVVTLHPGEQKLRIPANGALEGTFRNLNNGVAYQASVQAFNSSEKPSESSDLSAQAIPFGKPGRVSNVTATIVETDSHSAKVKVTWTYGDGNGREVTSAKLAFSNGQSHEVQAPRSEANIEVPLGTPFWVDVQQITEYGGSDPVRSKEITPYAKPPAPNPPQVRVTGPNKVEVTGGSANPGGGFDSARLSLQLYNPAQGKWVDYDGIKKELGGFEAGHPAKVEMRAYAKAGNTVYESPAVSAVSPTNVYGKPNPPAVEVSSTPTTVDFIVDLQSGANGATVKVYYRGTNQPDRELRSSILSIPAEPGETVEVEFRSCDDHGNCSDGKSYSGTVPPKYGFKLVPCPDGRGGGRHPCNEIRVSYADVNAKQNEVTCTFTDPVYGPQQVERLKRDRMNKRTGLRTSYTDVEQLHAAVTTGEFRCS